MPETLWVTSCEVGNEEGERAHTQAANVSYKKPFVSQHSFHYEALVTREVAIRSGTLLRTEGRLVCDSGHA